MDFLTAVMHDPSVSMADRVHAAQAITQVESVSAIRAIDDVFFAAMMHKQWEDFSAEQQEYFNALPRTSNRNSCACSIVSNDATSLVLVMSSSCQVKGQLTQ